MLIGRRHLPELRLTTMRDFFDLVPPEWVRRWNKSSLTLELVNGTEVYFRPLEDEGALRGLTLGCFAVDEASEVPQQSCSVLRGRLRLSTVTHHRGLFATNPAGPDHWLYGRFVDPATRDGEHAYFEASTLENIFTPRQYRTDLVRAYVGSDRMRFLEGKWVASEDLVWPNWRDDVNWIEPFPIPIHWRRERAIDFGFVHSFVCLLGAWDTDARPERLVVYAEHVRAEATLEEHARAIHELAQREPHGWGGYHVTWADHDEQDRHELAKLSDPALRIVTRPAAKDRRLGIAAVNAGLLRQPDGWPRIFVTTNCTTLRKQTLGYRRPARTPTSDPDAVVKVDARGKSVDDACDAFRYLYYSRVKDTFRSEPRYQPGMTSADRAWIYRVARGVA